MNKNQTLVSLAIFTALYSQQSMADLRDQCLMGVPHFTGEVVQGDLNTLPVYIEADDAEINQPTQAVYQGNVDVRQGNRHLMADSVEVNNRGIIKLHSVLPIYEVDLIIKIINLICWGKMLILI